MESPFTHFIQYSCKRTLDGSISAAIFLLSTKFWLKLKTILYKGLRVRRSQDINLPYFKFSRNHKVKVLFCPEPKINKSTRHVFSENTIFTQVCREKEATKTAKHLVEGLFPGTGSRTLLRVFNFALTAWEFRKEVVYKIAPLEIEKLKSVLKKLLKMMGCRLHEHTLWPELGSRNLGPAV